MPGTFTPRPRWACNASAMPSPKSKAKTQRAFFREYFRFLEKRSSGEAGIPGGADDGILIDSSELPNSIHFLLTAVNNHGTISEEIRLIYVVQQRTGLPLFFRYVAGNVIDVSTMTRTIAELKANGINTKFPILDAGYYTGANVDALLDAGVLIHRPDEGQFQDLQEAVE